MSWRQFSGLAVKKDIALSASILWRWRGIQEVAPAVVFFREWERCCVHSFSLNGGVVNGVHVDKCLGPLRNAWVVQPYSCKHYT